VYRGWRRRWLGLLYLSPALLFVFAFTVWPLLQMAWMSLHNWSLISPPTWVGLDNYTRALHDRQFWVSFGFTLKYTLIITPILIIGGYLLALLTNKEDWLTGIDITTLVAAIVGAIIVAFVWQMLTGRRRAV
jgi:multiple sugar transport system permease protein